MKFIIYSPNYSPELVGIGKYNGELADFLVKKGVETTVLTAPPYYPEWRRHQNFKNWWSRYVDDNGVNVFRAPLYIPKNVTTVKRLLHLSSFALSSIFSLCWLLKYKPDVIILVQPTLFCAPAALLYSHLTRATSVMHIQDFEVDAMFALGMGRKGLCSSLARKLECWLTNKFDYVSSISHSMLENAKNKGVSDDKLLLFPNWSNTDFIHPEVDTAGIRRQWGYAENDKVVLYSGNIGRKQSLDMVLDVAQSLAGQENIKFLIIGDGAYSQTLFEMSQSMGLDNIQFKPLQPWELMPQVLAMADVHLVTQKRDSADIVLPSKLTNILSAGGHALVTADPDTELGKIARRHPGIYCCVEPDSKEAFLKGLNDCLAMDTSKPNRVARDYAINHLSRYKIIDRFVNDVKQRVFA